MRMATRMNLMGTRTGYMTPEHKQTGPFCNLRNQLAVICSQVSLQEDSDLHGYFDENEDKIYSTSLHLGANEWLAFWLFLVASSYFLSSKIAKFFSCCRIKPAEKVSLPDRTIPNARSENDATDVSSKFSCSENSGYSLKCDAYSEISDLDRASYWDSLLSLDEEDTEWLSDSKAYRCSSERPSTSPSYKCDSFSEISDSDTPGYWDSLLRLEGKDSEWISDSKLELDCVRDGSPSPSYTGSWGIEVLPSVSTVSSLTSGVHCSTSEDSISAEHLLETADKEEFSVDEPLFWPFEGKLNWNSEDSWSSFCSSPRRMLVFDSRSPTSRIKECKQKDDEAVCSVKSETSRLSMWSKSSAKAVPLEREDEKVVLERGEVLSNQVLSLSKTFLNEDFALDNDLPLGREYFALDQELPIEALVGLKEFDGHEGLDTEFNGDVFMLDESLQ